MSWMWLVWLALSVFIVGIFVVTTRALVQQKKAWKAFADKNKLTFVAGKFLGAATVKGTFQGYDFLLTSEEREVPDVRGRKYVSVVQFRIPVNMPVVGMVASGSMKTIMAEVDAREVFTPTFEGWDSANTIIKTDNQDLIAPYFTPERLRVLDGLVKQKSVSVLYVFEGQNAFLRLETDDPLLKTEQLEKLTSKLIPMLKALSNLST